MDRKSYESLVASGPQPQAAAFYRRAFTTAESGLRRDPFRLVHFWSLVASFVGIQWVISTRPEPWVWPVGSLLLGLILVSCFMILHELMHYAVVRNRAVSWLHAWVAGFYSGLTPDSWKDEHDSHHGALGRAGEDPDAVYDLDAWKNKKGARAAIRFLPGTGNWIGLVTRPFWWMAVHGQLLLTRYLRLERVPTWRKVLAVSVWVFDIAAQVGLIRHFGWRYGVFGFLIPVMIQNLLLTYFLLGTHLLAPRTAEMDPVLGSVSVRFDPILRFFFLDSGRHTEHHLFPGTSHRRLRPITRELHEKFPDRLVEVPYFKLIRTLESTGRVYVGNDLLWDPPSDQLSTAFRNVGGTLVFPNALSGPFSLSADEVEPRSEAAKARELQTRGTS